MTRHLLPIVSVIIPVFGQDESLCACLKSLELQTYPSPLFEVIVVENRALQSLASAVNQYPHARLICEPLPGSYAARNAGIKASKGHILAFTDADCVPNVDWISNGVATLSRSPQRTIVAGQIHRETAARRLSAIELYDREFFLRQDLYAGTGSGAVTANLIVSSTAFQVVGPFDPALLSGGDAEWVFRAKRHGYLLEYSASAGVWHPTMTNLRQLIAKSRRVTGGLVALGRRTRGTRLLVQVSTDLTDVMRRWRRFMASSRRVSLATRVTVLILIVLLQAVRIAERCRLAAGGQPHR